MAESFGHLLKRYRVAAGLSQEALAERAGVSVDAISYLERDVRHAPQRATLDLLVAALAVDDDSRRQIEEAAKLARARGPQAQPRGVLSDLPGKFLLNNLPPELTSFVDREREVAEIKELLQSYRLVTLVGTGGAGKTRCAIRVAQGELHGSGDGVSFSDLAPTYDPALVSTAIARTLRVQEAPNRPMLETLLAFLRRKRFLLILDNCEHVIDETRRVVTAVLNNCPDVRIVATSRESLSIAGEHVYRIPSLPVPSPSELLAPQQVSQYGAVQLFSDRAASADNSFTLTIDSAPHVADICRRLDGIPLAIELAAARVKALSPHELAQRLDERFRLLTAGDRSALPRHRTMRALIDWSYDLLSDDERRLFRTLSIFSGGFTLETAAAVCSEGEVDEIVVLDLLSSLVDKSLVQAAIVEGDTRYRLLESTRQYARQKLSSACEEETMAHAHARAFLGLAEQLSDAWEITSDRAWHAQAEPEVENFRSALSWAFGPRGDALLGQRLAGVLRSVWFSFGPSEGRRWVQAAQERVTADTPAAVLATLDLAEAQLAGLLMERKASLPPAERALARYRDLDDAHGIALAERQVGTALVFLGKIADGEILHERALEALRALGDRRSVIVALISSASARILAGDLHAARQRFSEALAAARAFGAETYARSIVLHLAEVEFRDGDTAEALRLANEALAVVRGSGDTLFDTLNVARGRHNMAAYLVALRRFDEARAAARVAVTAACDVQWSLALSWTLQHFAAIAALRPSAAAEVIEDRRRGARIIGYVEARLIALQALRQYTDQQEYDAMIPALRDALGEDELSSFMTEGASWSEDQAIAEAMLV
jgi:predicted ATPase/DNA-binding XRE family transcriptional regulator